MQIFFSFTARVDVLIVVIRSLLINNIDCFCFLLSDSSQSLTYWLLCCLLSSDNDYKYSLKCIIPILLLLLLLMVYSCVVNINDFVLSFICFLNCFPKLFEWMFSWSLLLLLSAVVVIFDCQLVLNIVAVGCMFVCDLFNTIVGVNVYFFSFFIFGQEWFFLSYVL